MSAEVIQLPPNGRCAVSQRVGWSDSDPRGTETEMQTPHAWPVATRDRVRELESLQANLWDASAPCAGEKER